MPIPRVIKTNDAGAEALVDKYREEEKKRLAAEKELEKYKNAEKKGYSRVNQEITKNLNLL